MLIRRRSRSAFTDYDPARLEGRDDGCDVSGPAQAGVVTGRAGHAFKVVEAWLRASKQSFDENLVGVDLDDHHLTQHVGGWGCALILEIDEGAVVGETSHGVGALELWPAVTTAGDDQGGARLFGGAEMIAWRGFAIGAVVIVILAAALGLYWKGRFAGAAAERPKTVAAEARAKAAGLEVAGQRASAARVDVVVRQQSMSREVGRNLAIEAAKSEDANVPLDNSRVLRLGDADRELCGLAPELSGCDAFH